MHYQILEMIWHFKVYFTQKHNTHKLTKKWKKLMENSLQLTGACSTLKESAVKDS